MNEALKRPLPCEQEERGRAKVEGKGALLLGGGEGLCGGTRPSTVSAADLPLEVTP